MTLTIDPVLETVWFYYPDSDNCSHISFSELSSVGVYIAENELLKYHSITV
ncbi:hypothetical protein QNE33_004450 [Vibrio alginolyticus]|nr:hypothetical protein [Vibrio alginolyticus]ELB2908922.1 hypothetical protein [Vibrio alginolyticus]